MQIINLDKNRYIENDNIDFFEIHLFYNKYFKIDRKMVIYNIFENAIIKAGNHHFYASQIIVDMLGNEKIIYLIDAMNLEKISRSKTFERWDKSQFKHKKKEIMNLRKNTLNNTFSFQEQYLYGVKMKEFIIKNYLQRREL